jgi:hypothetical protein
VDDVDDAADDETREVRGVLWRIKRERTVDGLTRRTLKVDYLVTKFGHGAHIHVLFPKVTRAS